MRSLARDGRVADRLDVVAARVAGFELAQQQIAVADHRGHQIVEVVRDAAGELADRLHLLRLAQLLLELVASADVFDQADPDAVLEVESDVHVRVERRAVLAHVALVDRERIAPRIVELVLHGELAVVRVRDVGVVHPRELLTRVAEHALERRVRLAHDPIAADGDPDRRAFEDEAKPLLGLLSGGGRTLELADQAGDAVDDEERARRPTKYVVLGLHGSETNNYTNQRRNSTIPRPFIAVEGGFNHLIFLIQRLLT